MSKSLAVKTHKEFEERFSARLDNDFVNFTSEKDIFNFYIRAGFNPVYNSLLELGENQAKSAEYYVHILDKREVSPPQWRYSSFEPYFTFQ